MTFIRHSFSPAEKHVRKSRTVGLLLIALVLLLISAVVVEVWHWNHSPAKDVLSFRDECHLRYRMAKSAKDSLIVDFTPAPGNELLGQALETCKSALGFERLR